MVTADSSIYSNMRGLDLSGLVGSYQKGLTMRDFIDQRQLKQKQLAEEQGIKDAFRSGVVQNPDGTTSFDSKTTLSSLYKVNPQKAVEYEQQIKTQDIADQEAKKKRFDLTVDFFGRAVNGIKDQNSYLAALKEAQGLGLDISSMPQQWGPDAQQKVNFYAGQVFTAKDRFDQEQKNLENKRKDQELGLKKEELGIKRVEAVNKTKSGEKLPLDQKKLVETLSTKNANKIAIKNQIQAVVDSWDNLSDEQKVTQGGQLLKTLNSSEGADAIGVEEAKRLGSMLEFQMFNVTQPGAFVGRDLKGFKTQAQNTANNIGTAVESNSAIIDRAMGRPAKPSTTKTQQTQVFKTSDIEW